MALLRAGDHDEIYQEAVKYIALHDSIPKNPRDMRMDKSNREDLHYMANKLRDRITENIEDAENSYSY